MELSMDLADVDVRILEIVSRLRVITQPQLERLLDDVPDRTLRYRTRRLHRLRLLGRTRPYRERGSAPHHLWPTSRADALVRGWPRPRRGERPPPSPLFLAHSASISELYVVLRTQGPEAGLTLADFRREGECRASFTDAAGRQRAIAPDAQVALRAADGHVALGNVELDLGTMSHGRLRTKLDGYLCHAQRVRERPPALLFLTTSTMRAMTFRRSIERMRARADRCHRGEDLAIAICARVRRLDGVLEDRCWYAGDDGGAERTLGELL